MPKNRKTYPLSQCPFYALKSRKRLASLLFLSDSALARLSKKANSFYHEWDDTNAKGKIRHIENPHAHLKEVQSRIADLLSRIEAPDYLFCPVKGKSYVTNADRHKGGAFVSTLDVKAYFPSTPSRRVYWFFHSVMRCSEDVAAVLTQISCFNGRLPTGSPLSPILSYFSHVDMWSSIADIVEGNGDSMSVYMDDLTVSGRQYRANIIWEIKKQIKRAGLDYHKEHLYTGNIAVVTGMILSRGRLQLPFKQHAAAHKLRGQLITAAPPENPELARKLQGYEAQIRQVAKVNAAL